MIRTAVPMYHQLYSVLRQRIIDGTHGPGERLAAEGDLAVEWGVSRMTVRQALGALQAEGLLSREPGRGTFVNPVAYQAHGPILHGSIADLIAATGTPQMTAIEVVHDAELPVPVARRLELDEPRGTIVRRIRVAVDGSPLGSLVNYLSIERGALITSADLARSTLLEILDRNGVALHTATQSIRAQVADRDVADDLGIPVSEPVLAIERVVYDEAGDPVEFLRSWYRSDLYSYTVNFTRGGPTP